ANLPEGSDHVVSAGAQESPGEADETLAGIGACAGTIAGGNGDELRLQGMCHDVPGIKLVGIALLAENDGGLQRTRVAGSTVRHKMQVGKSFGVGTEISRRGRLLAFKDFPLDWRKISGDLRHLCRSLGQGRKIRVRRLRISDQEQVLALCRNPRRGRSEKSERVAGSQDDIFDPEVRLRVRNDEGLEIQSVQTLRRKQNHPGTFGYELACRLYKHRIQLRARGTLRG